MERFYLELQRLPYDCSLKTSPLPPFMPISTRVLRLPSARLPLTFGTFF